MAAAAGKSWEDLSDEALYRPLGMSSTSSRFADFIARPNHAVNHVKVGDKWEPRFQREPDPETPAGGVSSSVNDMARWLTMVMANGTYNGPAIIAPEALPPAITPQIVSAPRGRRRRGRVSTATGSTPRRRRRGARCTATRVPSRWARRPTSW